MRTAHGDADLFELAATNCPQGLILLWDSDALPFCVYLRGWIHRYRAMQCVRSKHIEHDPGFHTCSAGSCRYLPPGPNQVQARNTYYKLYTQNVDRFFCGDFSHVRISMLFSPHCQLRVLRETRVVW